MDAYQAQQQIGRARTFAEIRRIEARAGRMAPARRRARWPLGALAARRRGPAAAGGDSSTAGANVPCV
jgi:hypothetical protein